MILGNNLHENVVGNRSRWKVEEGEERVYELIYSVGFPLSPPPFGKRAVIKSPYASESRSVPALWLRSTYKSGSNFIMVSELYRIQFNYHQSYEYSELITRTKFDVF